MCGVVALAHTSSPEKLRRKHPFLEKDFFLLLRVCPSALQVPRERLSFVIPREDFGRMFIFSLVVIFK